MAPLATFGLRLMLLTGQCPGEGRKAERRYVNLDAGTWFAKKRRPATQLAWR